MLCRKKSKLHHKKGTAISENLLAVKAVLLPSIDFVRNILPTKLLNGGDPSLRSG